MKHFFQTDLLIVKTKNKSLASSKVAVMSLIPFLTAAILCDILGDQVTRGYKILADRKGRWG